jgi:TM2 domain-containing membrane protein YozV
MTPTSRQAKEPNVTTPMMTPPEMLPPMTEQQRTIFYALLPGVQRNELVGVLLAVILGSFGAHHFYLRRNGLGALYLLLFWTGIPALLGLIEAFFMPGRVRRYNAEQAAALAHSLVYGGGVLPPLPMPMTGCPACGMVQSAGVRYCVQCGRAMA